MFASQGRRDLARVEYEEAARLGSPDPWVYLELGLEHAREGNTLLAIDMFRKATERDPSFGEAHYNLAMACAQEGMDEEAVKSFTRALELLPDREEVRLGTLAFLTERGRFAEALTLLLSGTMTTTQEQLAAFEIMNRISESAEEIRADTSSAGGRFLAKFLEPVRKSRQGRWEAAIGDLVALRNEYPHVLPILYFEAWALQRKGSTDEARAAYELFLTRVPGVYDARINLGAAYVNLGKLSEAREIFEEILAERPGDTMALVNLANAYTKEGKLEESLVLLQQALEHDPESYIAGVNLGIVLEGLSRTDEAIARYESLLISRRETPELYVRLAGCYMRKGDLVRTRENLGRALALDPSYAPARNALASLDERGGASGQTQDSQGGNR
jgi:tetratricopeptide (TPR) repeat protein